MGPPGEQQAFPAELLGRYINQGDKAGSNGRRRRSVPDFQSDMAVMVEDMGSKQVELKEGVTLVVSRLFSQIDQLRAEVKKIRYPTGQEDSPAPTCRDIQMVHEDAKDGMLDFLNTPGYFHGCFVVDIFNEYFLSWTNYRTLN